MLPVKTKSVCWKAKRIIRLVPYVLALAISCACGSAPPTAASGPRTFDALVFTRTTGFRHDSIPAGVAAIKRLATQHDFRVDTTSDPHRFTARSLRRYDVVIFLSTTGTPIKDEAQRSAFESYIRRGGG